MFRRPLSRTLALGLSLAPLALASAQSAPPVPTYVFTAVDEINIDGANLKLQVTGLIQGENTPRTVTLAYSHNYTAEWDTVRTFERCERMALLAMNKPGRYLFEIRQDYLEHSTGLIGCKLKRLP